ncbi:twin transmembrane helix small protein [Epibacterium ulvae]|uniref:twin transmembrane helix small protein n=1 Tax=Epibacterium ulvae TaxID=1156985 RepID=UPI0024931B28|nr:twin transmembrane helix small protein [Epibacterium ulvae]
MDLSFYILGLLGVTATAIVLVIGLGSFGKGGVFHRKHSNTLMRLRLLFQFIAVVLLLIFMYLRQGA